VIFERNTCAERSEVTDADDVKVGEATVNAQLHVKLPVRRCRLEASEGVRENDENRSTETIKAAAIELLSLSPSSLVGGALADIENDVDTAVHVAVSIEQLDEAEAAVEVVVNPEAQSTQLILPGTL